MGSNNTQTRFRVLKIDRTEPKDLEIYDDKVEYSAEEIGDLVNMIESGNRKSGSSGISRYISAFGIVGMTVDSRNSKSSSELLWESLKVLYNLLRVTILSS